MPAPGTASPGNASIRGKDDGRFIRKDDCTEGTPMASFVSRYLTRAPGPAFSAYCMAAAFGTYFCMYAFRKPFTAGKFEGHALGMVDYKTVLVIAQTMGYTLSKFLGIKVVSEMRPEKRAWMILGLIAISHLALLLFGMVPPPYNFALLFLNGLPLGMVFGLVLGFLEGRQLTEMLAAGLCASFILSSGVVKSVGQWLIQSHGYSEYQMPFMAGLVCVWMLSQIPPPNQADVSSRAAREPVDGAERKRFYRRHALGLALLISVFTLLTVLRSLRDDFAVEIWQGLGTTGQPDIFTRSETWVMLGVLFVNGASCWIRDNRRAFVTAMGTITMGFVLVLAALFGYRQGMLGPFNLMVLIGLGMYIPYVAFHTTLFERMIAVYRDRVNLGFLITLADSVGYLGYVLVLLARSFVKDWANFLDLFLAASLIIGLLSLVMMAISWVYFLRRMPEQS
jgi:hypothetical protein